MVSRFLSVILLICLFLGLPKKTFFWQMSLPFKQTPPLQKIIVFKKKHGCSHHSPWKTAGWIGRMTILRSKIPEIRPLETWVWNFPSVKSAVSYPRTLPPDCLQPISFSKTHLGPKKTLNNIAGKGILHIHLSSLPSWQWFTNVK